MKVINPIMYNSIRFLHIRPETEDHKPAVFGGKTVAFTLTDMPEEGRLLRFAVAKCGKKQAFNRRLGREVASGMLNCPRPTSIAKHVKELVIEDDVHPYDVLAEHL